MAIWRLRVQRLTQTVMLLFVLGTAACGSSDSPTGPSRSVTPPSVSLTGTVTASTGGTIAGANLMIGDGPNAGRDASTNNSGQYQFTGLTPGNANVGVSAPGYVDTVRGVALTGTHTLNIVLAPVPSPPFVATGAGNTVFDMPRTVRRVRVRGTWNGVSNSNFIVRIGGTLVVNEILREMADRTYDGIHATMGGQVEITNSSGISWSFEEIR